MTKGINNVLHNDFSLWLVQTGMAEIYAEQHKMVVYEKVGFFANNKKLYLCFIW